MITVMIAAALIVSAAGNAVLGIVLHRNCVLLDAVLRMIPDYRERGSVGTPRIFSPYEDKKFKESGDKE